MIFFFLLFWGGEQSALPSHHCRDTVSNFLIDCPLNSPRVENPIKHVWCHLIRRIFFYLRNAAACARYSDVLTRGSPKRSGTWAALRPVAVDISSLTSYSQCDERDKHASCRSRLLSVTRKSMLLSALPAAAVPERHGKRPPSAVTISLPTLARNWYVVVIMLTPAPSIPQFPFHCAVENP